jgi:uncharacterized protein YjbJ (UPF0337 family)
MDKDIELQGKGKLERAKGSVRSTYGEVTGDRSQELRGKGENFLGRIMDGLGSALRSLRGDRTAHERH